MDEKYIGYEELEAGHNYPRLRDNLAALPYPHKDKIIHYLLDGEIEAAKVSRDRDIFTGKLIPTEVLIMSDGTFLWCNVLAYYIDKYNLRLPKDFEEHILSHSK